MLRHLWPSLLAKESPKNDKIREIVAVGLHPLITILESGLSLAEALKRERDWIAKYGRVNLTNKTTGGQGVQGFAAFKGKHHTAQTKEKLRQVRLGPLNPMFGRKRSKSAIQKSQEKMRGSKHPMWGKHHALETRQKISQSLKGCHWSGEACQKRSDGMKKVWEERRKTGMGLPRHLRKMLECDGMYLSLDEWAERTGIPKGTLRSRLKKGVPVRKALGLD